MLPKVSAKKAKTSTRAGKAREVIDVESETEDPVASTSAEMLPQRLRLRFDTKALENIAQEKRLAKLVEEGTEAKIAFEMAKERLESVQKKLAKYGIRL